MKKSLIVWPVVSLLLYIVVSFGFSIPAKKKPHPVNVEKGFALVELFTSEGCSSCPPADEAVAALAKDHPNNVYVLGFHVDYWNYLGWKDEFSSAGYSKRQQEYAAAFNLNSIYTPQAIVNGKIQFTGSEKTTLYNTVDKELNEGDAPAMELSAKRTSANEVTVAYATNANDKAIVCIALVQAHASSVVKRGENKGMLLQHINVVRDFKTMAKNSGTAGMHIPAGLAAKDCKIIAFAQHKNDMQIVCAAGSAIE